MDNKCCDNCKYYEWYHDKCSKWNCEIDCRSCCDSFSPNKQYLELHPELQNTEL